MIPNMAHRSTSEDWPALSYEDWEPTCTALHLRAQIVGKARLTQTPWVNHSWHATFYLTARGLTTSTIAYGPRTLQVDFDFIANALRIATRQQGRLHLSPVSAATETSTTKSRS